MCRERWHNYLDPEITTQKITPNEELKIFELYKTYGNKWVEIAKNLPGRTENWVKNLYYATLRRYVRNINKLKSVHPEIEQLDYVEVNEKVLGELLLLDNVDFKAFQAIDSPEFKLLSKKVGKCRRRKDDHLAEYLIGKKLNQTRRKSKAAANAVLTQSNIEILDQIKIVLDLLQSTRKLKLAPVRILKEEGKDGNFYCKSRPRRRSTLKKNRFRENNPSPMIYERRRSKRIQESLKRNSKEFTPQLFVTTTNSVTKDKISRSPVIDVDEPSLVAEEKKDEVLTDNECGSLKIPSLKEFNLSNPSNR